MKSEPNEYSIDDLERDGTEPWAGIRNYQARNFMRDEMKIGDEVLFYHSNAKPPGVVGTAHVCKESYPDDTAWARFERRQVAGDGLLAAVVEGEAVVDHLAGLLEGPVRRLRLALHVAHRVPFGRLHRFRISGHPLTILIIGS